jgi:hypothetical protein
MPRPLSHPNLECSPDTKHRLILNEPAGKIALIVVKHTVELIVEAWFDRNKDVGQTINQASIQLEPILYTR